MYGVVLEETDAMVPTLATPSAGPARVDDEAGVTGHQNETALTANRRASSIRLGVMINFGLARVLTPSCDPSIDAKSPPGFRFIYGRRFCLLPTCAIKAFSLAKKL